MQQNHASGVKLAPPGAGIPAMERIVGGFIFAFRRWAGSRERFAEEFDRERTAIARAYQGRPASVLGERVLIPRLRGLEDSSRLWSVWMTLDHLRIVNDQIGLVIGALVKGQVPPGQASTAAVKPGPDVGEGVVAAYEASCDRFIASVASCSNLRTTVRFPHPWFGPLDGAGWHAMAAMHMGIHHAQIERILAGTSGGVV